MVKNKFGGKGAKRQSNKAVNENLSRKLLLKEDEQNYGKVIKCLGSCRFEIFGMDGKTYLGVARGKMRKKIWINLNNIVLFSYRNFEDDKIDIIHKYNEDEVKQLIKLKEIPSKIEELTNGVNNVNDSEDDGILFDEI